MIKYIKARDRLVQKYFISALTLRIIGAIGVGLVYFFYYKGGDTQSYYKDGLVVSDLLINQPLVALKVIFLKPDIKDPDIFGQLYRFENYLDEHSFTVSKTVGIFNFFSFGMYSISAFFFAILSLSGSWALFVTFCKVSPELEKESAISALFLPSVIFWGSGILKDTLTYSAMGWFVFGAYMIFIEKRKKKLALLILFLSAYVMYSVKLYVLMSIIPAILVWVFLLYTRSIKNRSTRAFLKPIILGIAVVIGIAGITLISRQSNRYSLQKIVETSSVTASYLKTLSVQSGGSAYDLGDFEPSLFGTIKMFIPAINVTLFRPYPWEIRNVLMLFSSVESFIFLLVTLLFIYRVGFKKISSIISEDPFLLLCLIFSAVFAFAIGVSTYNFGSLVRYKIPMLPFYAFLLFSIYDKGYKTRIRKNARRKF